MQRLTSAQDGIWRGQQLAPGDPMYNAAECITIDGPVDVAALDRALREVLAEADAVRTAFSETPDGPRQQPGALPSPPIVIENVASAADPDATRSARIQADLARTADLERGPLAGHRLFTEGDRTVWHHRAHHIALDGYGFALFGRRVAERYGALVRGTPERLAFDPIAPVLAEDREYTASEQCVRDRRFWCDKLADCPQPASPGGVPPALVAGRERVRDGLDAEHRAAVEALAQRLGVSWPDLLLAVTAAWLSEATESGEIVLGLPVMDRMGSAALRVPCMAMNIVPLRVDVPAGVNLEQLAVNVAAAMRELRPHRRYRYEWLRRDLGMVGGGRRLFGPVVNIMPFDTPLEFGGLPARTQTVSAGPVEDLSFSLRPRGDALEFELEGHPGLYDQAALAGHQRDWRALLERALEDPQCALVTAGPSGAHASIVNGPPLGEHPCVLPRRLAKRVEHDPARTAIEADSETLDYATLWERARRCGQGIRAHGVGPGDHVAIMLRRSAEAIIAVLGANLAGAAWLGLDPDAPAARNAAILDDAGPALVIGPDRAAGWPSVDVATLCTTDDGACALPPIVHGDIAYLVYTSGSTGTPKGVVVDHGALAHFVIAAIDDYGLRKDDRVLQFASLSFDACVEEIFGALVTGATLIPRPPGSPAAPADLLAWCAERSVTVLDLPTAYWHELVVALESGSAYLPPTLRRIIVGGEAVLPERLAAWRRIAGDRIALINTYGPSETTVVATSAHLHRHAEPEAGTTDPVSIGRPLAGVTAAVVDGRGRAVPRGTIGELVLAGPTVARGYLNRPQQTDACFSPAAALGYARRAYYTGDRVRLDERGCLRFHGRADEERKISGHRVTPGEIESVLIGHPEIEEAAVVPVDTGLTAHVTAAMHVTAADLRAWMLERLPAPLVPGRVVLADALPRTAGGKIDRGALRDSAQPAPGPEGATRMEQCVLAVWAEVLGQADITPQDDFFARGGTSLQVIQVAHRLGALLEQEVPLATLFQYPVVADLARVLEQPLVADADAFDTLLTLRDGAPERTLYCFAPAAGLAWCYKHLARQLPAGLRVVGVQAPALVGQEAPADLGELCATLASMLRQVHPGGPWHLLGWSFGGLVAHGVAAYLQADGDTVEQLTLVDAYPSDCWRERGAPDEAAARTALRQIDGALAGLDADTEQRLIEVTRDQLRLAHHARHRRFDGDVLFVGARTTRVEHELSAESWRPYVRGQIETVEFDTDHIGMLADTAVAALARRISTHEAIPSRCQHRVTGVTT